MNLIKSHLANQLSKIPYEEAKETIERCNPRDAYFLVHYVIFNHLKANNPLVANVLGAILRTHFDSVAEILRNYDVIIDEVYKLNPKLGSLLKTKKGKLFMYYISYYSYQLLHYIAFGKYRE